MVEAGGETVGDAMEGQSVGEQKDSGFCCQRDVVRHLRCVRVLYDIPSSTAGMKTKVNPSLLPIEPSVNHSLRIILNNEQIYCKFSLKGLSLQPRRKHHSKVQIAWF